MTPSLGACILLSHRVPAMLAFYRAIGVPLEEEDDGDGLIHWACELGDLHFAIFDAPEGEAPGRRTGGSTQVGFRVENVLATLDAVMVLGAPVVIQPEEVPWGLRCVVVDPDHRSVEIWEVP